MHGCFDKSLCSSLQLSDTIVANRLLDCSLDYFIDKFPSNCCIRRMLNYPNHTNYYPRDKHIAS